MQSSLNFARYDNKFVMGSGGHDMAQGFSIMPESMKWLWRDYPGVESNMIKSDPALIIGEWEVSTDIWGFDLSGTLKIAQDSGVYTAEFDNGKGACYLVDDVSFEDGLIEFKLFVPDVGDNPLEAWLHVEGEYLEGPLGGDDDGMAADYPLTGKRVK